MKIVHFLCLIGATLIGGSAYNWWIANPQASRDAQLPTRFSIEQRAQLLTGHKFNVVAAGHQYGTVEEKFGFTPTFEYRTNEGNLLAIGQKAVLALATTIDIFDTGGGKMGQIKQQLFPSGLSFMTEYAIFDGRGQELAHSEKVPLLQTEITLYDKSQRRIAKLLRGEVGITDDWSVDINLPGIVDERLIIMIAAYKSFADAGK